MSVRISNIFVCPGESQSISSLLNSGLKNSELNELLCDGFMNFRLSSMPIEEMVSKSINGLLSKCSGGVPIDLVLIASDSVNSDDRIVETTLPERLGIRNQLMKGLLENHLFECNVVGLWLNGCSNLSSALEHAAAVMNQKKYKRALLITVDKFNKSESRLIPPKRSSRIKIHGIASDVAVAAEILREDEGEGEGLEVLYTHTQSNIKILDELDQIGEGRNELSYIYNLTKLAKKASTEFQKKAGLGFSDVDHVVAGNYLESEIAVYLSAMGIIDLELNTPSKYDFGHSVSSDCLISLSILLKEKNILPGEKILLITFGPFSIALTLLQFKSGERYRD